MKCIKCNKQIPSVSTICPYCSTPVENNGSDGSINFGDIENINYDQKNELKTYVSEPEKHKSKKILILPIIFIVIVIAVTIFMMRPKAEQLDKYFMNTLENIKSIMDEKIFNEEIKSGNYELSISVNGENNEFYGHYSSDNNMNVLDGIKRDVLEDTSGVVLDHEELSFNAYIKNNDLYFKSNKLMDSYIKYNFNLKIGLMKDKEIANKLYDAIKNTLKSVDYHAEDVDINYRGIQTTTKKYYFTLDNNKRLMFIKSFYNSLLNDDEFIEYYAKSNNKTSEEIVGSINKLIEEAETKYNNESNNTLFALYVNNKNIIRYYIEDKVDDKTYAYQLDFKDGKYFFDYFIDNVNVISATLIKIEKKVDKQRVINYSITFDTDDNVRDIVINFEPDVEGKLENGEMGDYVSYDDLTDEQKLGLRNNLIPYISNRIIDDFLKIWK